MTTRVIDVACLNLMSSRTESDEASDNILWMGVLSSLNGYQMYRQEMQERVQGLLVTEFLMRDDAFPRSVRHAILEAKESLSRLPRHADAKTLAEALSDQLGDLDVASVIDSGRLHAFIDDIQADISAIHANISETWFLR
jgi:uncharacterized alpha-E superfamily protein